jgi:hypothetical protein
MHNFEAADVILGGHEVMDERPAHVIDFVDKVAMKREWAAMVVDSVDALMVRLVLSLARKDMNLVVAALEGSGHLRDVDVHAANSDGMKSFPGKQGNSHVMSLCCTRQLSGCSSWFVRFGFGRRRYGPLNSLGKQINITAISKGTLHCAAGVKTRWQLREWCVSGLPSSGGQRTTTVHNERGLQDSFRGGW